MDFDVKTEVMQLTDELKNVCSSDNELVEKVEERLKNDVYPLLKVDKPKIMVYGIYNAGKSTLINALFGKEVAEVRDAPMTWKITEYDVGDYILVDSPGVDAPIEHEKVTEGYLKNCHVILYVISTKGGFESRKNYENLYKLIKIGKPFIIVINDKTAEKDINKSELIKDIKFKVLENLARVSGEANLDSKYDIIAVNGNRGKPGSKPAIYALSNVGYLKERISYFLKNKNAMAMYYAPIGNVIKIVDDIMENIQSTLACGNDNAGDALNRIRYERIDVIEQLPSRIKSITGGYYEAFNSSLLNDNHSNWNSIFNSISTELESEFEEIKEKVKYIMNESGIPDFKIDDINLFLNSFNKSMPTIDNDSINVEKEDDYSFDSSDFYNKNDSSVLFNQTSAVSGDISGNLLSVLPIIGKLIMQKLKREREKEIMEFQRLKAEIEMQNNLAIERATIEANKRQEVRMHVETTIHNISAQMTREMTGNISKLFDYIQNYILAYISNNENLLKEKQEFINKLQSIKRSTESLKNSIQ